MLLFFALIINICIIVLFRETYLRIFTNLSISLSVRSLPLVYPTSNMCIDSGILKAFPEILLFSNAPSIDIRGFFYCVLKLANWRSSQFAVIVSFKWEVSVAWVIGHDTVAPAVWIFGEFIMGARAEFTRWICIPEISNDSEWFRWNANSFGWTPLHIGTHDRF